MNLHKNIIKRYAYLNLRKNLKISQLNSKIVIVLELWKLILKTVKQDLLRAQRHKIQRKRIRKFYYKEFGLFIVYGRNKLDRKIVSKLLRAKVVELILLVMRKRFKRNRLERIIKRKKLELMSMRWQHTAFGLYNACVATHFFRKWFLEITLRLLSYNAFFEIRERFADRTTFVGFKSASHYKIKLSSKAYRPTLNRLLKIFFKDLRVQVFVKVFQHQVIKNLRNMVIANIIAPRKVRRRLLTSFGKIFKKQRYMVVINLMEKAIFNGCRARKSRRLKKRKKGFRYYRR